MFRQCLGLQWDRFWGGSAERVFETVCLLPLLAEQCEATGLVVQFDLCLALPSLAGRPPLLQIWSICAWNMMRMMIFSLQNG